MDLYSGLPYWIARNELDSYFNPLTHDLFADVLIIGSGITGALVAHELCSSGVACTMIDKRSVSCGSSVASTALLQYEIDTPLCELSDIMCEDIAVRAYRSSVKSVEDIRKVFEQTGVNASYKKVDSVYYASNNKGVELLEKEYEIRKKYSIPVEKLDHQEVCREYGFSAPLALRNSSSAQMDPYRGATGLIEYHKASGKLDVYTNTEIKKYSRKKDHYQLKTDQGHKIRANYVVVAAGFEAGKFLKEKVMDLTSTYAIVSEPIDPSKLWKGDALLWETRSPYLYIRITPDNRILVGGEDEPFRNPEKRDELLRKKVAKLEKKFRKLFSDIPFKTDMAWCGTFSTTCDGLPFIGQYKDDERMLYALGYGGNGITFSMIAAQIIRNKLSGIPDDRQDVFGFSRLEK